MDVRVGLWRRLSTEELILLNCGVGEDSWESLGLQGNGWMASLTRWTWVWVNGSWWWTGGPGVLQFMGSQRVGHDWVTDLIWLQLKRCSKNGSYAISYLNFPLAFKWLQTVKHLSAMQETWVRSLGLEDHLETEMAAHSFILAWNIPWIAEPCRLLSMGWQRVGHDWETSLHFWPSSKTTSP